MLRMFVTHSACIVRAIVVAHFPSLFKASILLVICEYYGSRSKQSRRALVEVYWCTYGVSAAMVQLRRVYGIQRNYYGVLV